MNKLFKRLHLTKKKKKICRIKNFKLQSYQEFDNFICNSLIQSKMGEKKKKKKETAKTLLVANLKSRAEKFTFTNRNFLRNRPRLQLRCFRR